MMRCGCKNCETYMVQMESGLKSGCKCPDCGAFCSDCMGSAQKPMSREALKVLFENETNTPDDAGASVNRLMMRRNLNTGLLL